jgi:O-antigen ligase
MEELINYTSASSYGVNSLNRMTVIPYMHEVLFDRDTIGSLFGVGLGNADSSGFAFLVSDIYKKYGDLKYSYFMHGMLYMEMGAVGLVSYILFFVLNFFTSLKKANQKGQKPLAYAGTVFNAIAIITIFYNTTLRSEVSCFLTFFILAIACLATIFKKDILLFFREFSTPL